MILTVTVPDLKTFEAYDYGYGEVLRIEDVVIAGRNWKRYTIAFESKFHAEYQRDRFLSGMYGASLLTD